MSPVSGYQREFRFLLRQRPAMVLLLFVAACSGFAVWSGIQEVASQRTLIDRMITADSTDRENAIASQADYGGAAYYSFFLTYQPPTDSAFAAFGQRDDYPWKHRIRMLALEGQIYESDTGNPALAISGTFDFAFLSSVLLPLFVIVLLFDLYTSEHAGRRYHLLAATTGDDRQPWRARALVRVALLVLALLLPLWVGAAFAGAALLTTALVSLIVIAHALIWMAIVTYVARRSDSGPVVATRLLAVWVVIAVLIPFLGGQAISAAIEEPAGSDIVLGQREVVNAAWDLPKSDTMLKFTARYPEWREQAGVNAPFEWKWYYAFQQVGDQSVETLSEDRRRAIEARYSAGNALSLLSPPMLAQRLLGRATQTDVVAALCYEADVRRFHAALRAFYYPLLFDDPPYDPAVLQGLPQFRPSRCE